MAKKLSERVIAAQEHKSAFNSPYRVLEANSTFIYACAPEQFMILFSTLLQLTEPTEGSPPIDEGSGEARNARMMNRHLDTCALLQ